MSGWRKKQIEALKLALEALERGETELRWKTITAIKEALAQPEYQSTADKSKLEKVPAKGTLLAQQCVCGEPNSAGTHRIDGPCLAPQPEQEAAPVAKNEGGRITWMIDDWPQNCLLYTHTPPQRTWLGLTDDEIDQGLLRSDYAFKTAEAWRAGVVFAMTKLKEKNT